MNLDKEAVKVLAEEMMKAVKAIIQDNNKNYVNNQIRNYTGGTAAKFTGVIKPSQVKGLYGAVSGFLTDAADSISGYGDIDISTNAFVQAVTRLAKVEVQHIIANKVEAEELYASYGQFLRLLATDAEFTRVNAQQIKTDIASIGVANIGDAKISSANIEVADIDTAFIRKGLSGKYYIDNLAVTEGNIYALSVGKLMLKAEDGTMCQLKIEKDEEGNQRIVADPVNFDAQYLIEEGTIIEDALHDLAVTTKKIANEAITGDKILAGSIVTKHLDASEIFVKDAYILDLIAQNIKASTIFAEEGNITALETAVINAPSIGENLNIKSNASITLANDYIGLVINKDETDLEASSLVLTETMLAVTADKIDLRANKSVTSRIADSMYNRIITQPEEPEDPEFMTIWGDNSVSPIKYYQWTGYAWAEIEDTASIDSNSILLNALIQDVSTKISQTNDRILLEVTREESAEIKGELEDLSITVSRIDQTADNISLTVGRQKSIYVQVDTPMIARQGDVWRDPNSPDYFIAETDIDDGFEFAYDDDGILNYSYKDGEEEILEFGIENNELSYKPAQNKEWEQIPEALAEKIYKTSYDGVIGNWKKETNIAFSRLDVKVDRIYSTVYDSEHGLSVVEQTANKIYWFVTDGSTSSEMTLTESALTAIADQIEFAANKVVITSAGQISADAAEDIDLSANETVHIYSGGNIETEAMKAIIASVDSTILTIQDGNIKAVVGGVEESIKETSKQINILNDNFTRAFTFDDDGFHIGDSEHPNCEVLIDTDSVNVITNGSMESKFTGNYIQFGNYQLRRTADGGLAFKIKD